MCKVCKNFLAAECVLCFLTLYLSTAVLPVKAYQFIKLHLGLVTIKSK
jgi:hypothetical protein